MNFMDHSLYFICVKETHLILKKTLWTDEGLCNGSIGVMKDMIYSSVVHYLPQILFEFGQVQSLYWSKKSLREFSWY